MSPKLRVATDKVKPAIRDLQKQCKLLRDKANASTEQREKITDCIMKRNTHATILVDVLRYH